MPSTDDDGIAAARAPAAWARVAELPTRLRQQLQAGSSGDLTRYLVRGISASLSVQGVGLLFSVLSSVMLARALGAVSYGHYAYALALLEFLKIPVAYGHPLLIQRELAVRSIEGSWGYARGLLRRANQSVLTIAFVIVVSFYTLSRQQLLPGLAPGVQTTAFQIALLTLPSIGLSAVRGGALNGLHHVAQSQVAELVVRPMVTVVIVAAMWWLNRSALNASSAMMAQVAAVTVAFILGTILLRRALPPTFRRETPVYLSREWAMAALPFMLTGGAYVLWGTLSVIVLGYYRPSAEVGIYRTATLIAGLALMPVVVFNTTISPAVARLYAAGDKPRMQTLISSTTIILTAITTVALIVTAVAGRLMLRVMFGAPFQAAYEPLLALVVGHLLYASISNVMNVLDMSGHQRFSLYALLSSAALNLMLAPFLIPRFGMIGAAIATSSSWFLGHLWLVPVTRRKAGVESTLVYALLHARQLFAR